MYIGNEKEEVEVEGKRFRGTRNETNWNNVKIFINEFRLIIIIVAKVNREK